MRRQIVSTMYYNADYQYLSIIAQVIYRDSRTLIGQGLRHVSL